MPHPILIAYLGGVATMVVLYLLRKRILRLLGREVSKAGNAIAGDSTASKSPLR